MSLQGEKSQPLPNETLRLRSRIQSDDEESRIDCTSPRTLVLDSEPIRGEKTIAETETSKATLKLDLVERKPGSSSTKRSSLRLHASSCVGDRRKTVELFKSQLERTAPGVSKNFMTPGMMLAESGDDGCPYLASCPLNRCSLKSRKQKSKDSRKKKDDDDPRSGLRTLSTYVGIYNRISLNDASESLGKELLEHISMMKSRSDAAEHAWHHQADPDICGEDMDCPILRDAYMDEYGCPFDSTDFHEMCEVGKCRNCDEIRRDSISNKLANARRFSMITLCFRDPSLDVALHIAFVNEAWEVPTVVGVVTQRDLLEQLKYGCRSCRISTITDPGLMVHEEWLDWRESAVIPVTVCFFFTIVVGSRFLFGDWQTGLAAGGCFFAFLTIPVLWVSHAVRR